MMEEKILTLLESTNGDDVYLGLELLVELKKGDRMDIESFLKEKGVRRKFTDPNVPIFNLSYNLSAILFWHHAPSIIYDKK